MKTDWLYCSLDYLRFTVEADGEKLSDELADQFSDILKGDLKAFEEGANAIDNLKDGDKVLILESCTHHAIEDDIGRVKIPNLLRKKTGKNLIIENYAGHDFPEIMDYKLIIHCGACMTNRREVLSRILKASEKGVPITNYGITISYCLGILPRAIKIFKQPF